MGIKLEIFNSSEAKFLPKRKIRKAIENVFSGEKVNEAEINIIYVDNQQIQELNKQYLNHDYPTDVIAFSLGEKGIDGEVYISVERAREQAEEYKVSLTNELMRLSVHGTLHLVGYDDASAEERNRMHELENKYINF